MLFYENIAQVVYYMAQGAYAHSKDDLEPQINATERCAQALYSLNYDAVELAEAVKGNSRAYKLGMVDVEAMPCTFEGEELAEVQRDAILWNLAYLEVEQAHKAAQEEQA